MSNFFAVGLAVVIGALTSIQSAVNSELGKYIGGVAAALVSFTVGTTTLVVFYLFSGEGGLKGVTRVAPYLLIGGMFGAMFVFGMIKLVPRIGVSSASAGVIAGQLLLAMAIDHFGWFGVAKHSLNWVRGMGALLLLLGVRLMSK
ncbi:DMT family transporter [Thermincola ferriacetica]|nr:DMT family transporter [Thermincola ferriacetica]